MNEVCISFQRGIKLITGMMPCYSFFLSSNFTLQISLSLMPVSPTSFLQDVKTRAPAVLLLEETSTQLVITRGNIVWWAQKDTVAASISPVHEPHCCWPAGRGHVPVSSLDVPWGTAAPTTAASPSSENWALSSLGKSLHFSVWFSPCVKPVRGWGKSVRVVMRSAVG